LSESIAAASFPAGEKPSQDCRQLQNHLPRSGTNSAMAMKSLLAATGALLAANCAWGHTRETAIVAMMSLSETPNYSWISTVTDDARTYDIEGKTNGTYTWQRQPMPKNIARRLGRAGGHELEAIFSAPLTYVVQTESGWRALAELPKQSDDWNNDQWYYITVPTTVVRTPDMPADGSFDRFGLPPAVYMPVTIPEDDDGKVYSNAQFALALPHCELSVMVSSHADFQVEADAAAGTLTDIGAQLLLVHDGHEYIKPVTAGGRFKIWLKGDSVDKYTVELAGIVVVDKKAIYVRQKSTTVLKDVGITKVEPPPDARRRL
jgi:hypothetical protein